MAFAATYKKECHRDAFSDLGDVFEYLNIHNRPDWQHE